MTSPLRYLTIDVTDSSDDVLTVEAMASTRESQHAAVMAEVDQILAWARREFAGRHGPVEDGCAWDSELLIQREGEGWITVTLTLSASPEFVEAFMPIFGDHEE
jgi:hypothetical protein